MSSVTPISSVLSMPGEMPGVETWIPLSLESPPAIVSSPMPRWWIVVPLLTVLTQSAIKLLAERLGQQPFGLDWLKQAIGSPYVLVILVCESCGFFLWMRLLSRIDLGRAMPLTAIAYVMILGTSWAFFHEAIGWQQMLGSAFILLGVWLLGVSETPNLPPLPPV